MSETEIAVLKVQMESIRKALEDLKNDVNDVTKNWSRIIILAMILAQFISTGKIDKSVTETVAGVTSVISSTEVAK